MGQQDIDENDQQAMLFNDGNDVLHADPASLACYIVTTIRAMFRAHPPNLLPNVGRPSPRLGSLHGSSPSVAAAREFHKRAIAPQHRYYANVG
jgi:hypothetical protein